MEIRRDNPYNWVTNWFPMNELSLTLMWPWELKPQEVSTHVSELYKKTLSLVVLCYFYKRSFWGKKSILDPIIQFIQKDSYSFSLIYPLIFWKRSRIMVRVLMKWLLTKDIQDWGLIWNFYFLFIVDKKQKIPVNKFGYGYWNGGLCF